MCRLLWSAGLVLVVCACIGEPVSEPPTVIDFPCDPALPTACTDEAHGVFVRAAAPAVGSGSGSRSRPFGTLQAALEGRADKPFVFVCAGRYEENVRLTDSAVTLVGSLDCGTFAPGSDRTQIAPASGYPLEVAGAARVSVIDVDLTASTGSRSSVAAWIHDGANVSLRGARLASGRGADGVSIPERGACVSSAGRYDREEPGAVVDGEWRPADAPDGEPTAACGGSGGMAGGASVGLLSRAATLALESVQIATERGGHGGSGGDGAGHGGGGAGGASGIQAGILWIGAGTLSWNGRTFAESRSELAGIVLRDVVPTPGFGGAGGGNGGTPGRLGTVYAPLAIRRLP